MSVQISLGKVTELGKRRYVLTFRSYTNPSLYLELVLFQLSSETSQPQYYAMESTCPHAGAPLEHAEIELDLDHGIEDGPILVCPFHSYDFNLLSGESSTGLKACTYAVTEQDGYVLLEMPEQDDYRLLSMRAVSERQGQSEPVLAIDQDDPDVPSESSSLLDWVVMTLNTASPTLKVARTRETIRLYRAGKLKRIGSATPPDQPPRPTTYTVVDPGKIKSRKTNSAVSRIKLLHALASIEQWAIDLALDIVARFPMYNGKPMPAAFFADFLKVAEDEAKHFSLLCERLEAMGTHYGTLPIHAALWQSAQETSHDLISRICIIHLVHEARGLDVNPTQIAKVAASGDEETAEVLRTIHNDEVTHVATGHRWLTWICSHADPPMDPVQVFRGKVKEHFWGKLKAPFNAEDRATAGLSPQYYESLEGKGNPATSLSQAAAAKPLVDVSLEGSA
ncbi:uncharacterized protein L969DRAFT_20367 [Mixia osmundae IAM 14324]|uniref:Rieske domain-containing protein n=1 Tax=Mixia osmundae (strain CBS 9802 / IAM 14324 / JCM 22182 / KY 12970) TaxID=764103 RepID=G7DV26_MIXOS|nr:uncharacterized protein L969DRAFT_20367 [Mixia osmundae IAM 14324]KEI36347.1 hypothetical protein L969DRAFT_20367 [Mixia osmundae IAM 14324]GAA94436.1 hypothetical protein E5Q_01088 [Mixia osmundae IAM 14324]